MNSTTHPDVAHSIALLERRIELRRARLARHADALRDSAERMAKPLAVGAVAAVSGAAFLIGQRPPSRASGGGPSVAARTGALAALAAALQVAMRVATNPLVRSAWRKFRADARSTNRRMEQGAMMEPRMPNTGSNAAAASADMASRAHDALDSALDKAAPAVNRMVDKAHATIDRVAQSAVPAAEAMQSAVAQTREKSARMMESCANTVREQPLMAVGIAAAIGYLAGRLMR